MHGGQAAAPGPGVWAAQRAGWGGRDVLLGRPFVDLGAGCVKPPRQAPSHSVPPPLPPPLFPLSQAFTRSSQLEPENGEAWNNLAAIHMHLQHWRQAFNALSGAWWCLGRRVYEDGCTCTCPLFGLMPSRQHVALPHSRYIPNPAVPAEAVKHKRDSWQTWENYAQVAARVGQWQTAVRALQQVLVLSEGKRLDLSVLAALVDQVEAASKGEAGGAAAAAEGGEQQQQQQPPSDAAPAADGLASAAAAEPAAAEGSSEMADLASALDALSTGGAPGNLLSDPEAVQRAEQRAQEVLQQSVGNLLKQVAATASGDSAFWEVYARWGMRAACCSSLVGALSCDGMVADCKVVAVLNAWLACTHMHVRAPTCIGACWPLTKCLAHFTPSALGRRKQPAARTCEA